MSIRELVRRFSQLLHRERVTEDLEEEMRLHIELRTEANRRMGMSPEGAQLAARRRFGNRGVMQMKSREVWSIASLDRMGQDLRYARRALVRAPAFTAAAVITLALGIGANATMFGVVDTLLFRPPAQIHDPGRLVRIYFGSSDTKVGDRPEAVAGYGTYLALRDHVRGLESVGAYYPKQVSVGTGLDARSVSAVLATPSFFTMLGVRPFIGRFFTPDEERADGVKAAVLGYDAWRAKYSADSGIIGRSIDVRDESYTIVGVAPRGFTGVDLRAADLWLPIGAATRLFDPSALKVSGGGESSWLRIVGRRRSDVSEGQVAAEATVALLDWRRPDPMFEQVFSKVRVVVGPILAGRGPAANSDVRIAEWLGAVSLIVLLIACANVAGLMLARGLARSREMAIRLSLGATRGRLVRQILVEAMLLAAMGAACALVLARWSSSTLLALFIPDGSPVNEAFDWRLWVFAVLIALGAWLLASIAPAVAAIRQDFDSSLKVGAAGIDRNRPTLRRALVTGQVALTLLLLIGSGLFITSLRNVLAVDLGVDTAHVLYASVDLASQGMATPDINARYAAMLAQVRRLPGVRSASVSDGQPFASAWGVSLQVPGGEPVPPGAAMPFGQAVGTEYFETMGTTLREGRLFTDADQSPSSHVAIIDERTAHHFWPQGHAVGTCAHLDGATDCTQIVGIVATTGRWQITEQQEWYTVYVPLESGLSKRVNMIEVRAKGDPKDIVDAVRRAMQAAAPNTPYATVQPLSVRLDPQIRPWRLGASMFTAFGLLALALAAIGLYGLLSFMVAQRTREIGLRKALGSQEWSIVSLVVRSAMGMTIVGVLLGALAAVPAGRLIARQMYGVSPHDYRVFVLCAVVLTMVGLIASYAPARRAARIEPMDALRSD
jgi:putative ABC transport system permease protein